MAMDLGQSITYIFRIFWESFWGTVTSFVDETLVQIKLAMYNLQIELNNFMKTDAGFWTVFALGAVGIVAYPWIASLLVTTGVTAWFTGIGIAVSQYFAGYLNSIGFSEILLTHKIALLLVPEYRKIWQQIDEGLASFATQIGLGVGVLNVAVDSARTIYYQGLALLGLDADQCEAVYYDELSTFFSKLGDRTEKYLRRPQAIFDDLNQELVLPMRIKSTENVNSLVDAMTEVNTNLMAKEENINNIMKALNKVMVALPEPMQESVGLHWTEVYATYDEFRKEAILPWKKQTDALLGLLNEYVRNDREQKKRRDALAAKPVSALNASLILSETERTKFKNMLSYILTKEDHNGIDRFVSITEALRISDK